MRILSLVAVIAAAMPLVMAVPSELDMRNVDCSCPTAECKRSPEVDYFCLGKRELELDAREVDCSCPTSECKRSPEVDYFCLGKRELGLDAREVDCSCYPRCKREVNYFCLGKRTE